MSTDASVNRHSPIVNPLDLASMVREALTVRDFYAPQDINPPADGCEPDDDEAPDESVCPECGAGADEAHRDTCSEYVPSFDELEAQERRDWRRHVGREHLGGRRRER